MSWDLTYEITFGDLTGFTNITSDVTGFVTSIDAMPGEFGRSSVTLTIDNSSGNYTPNGTGTYSNIDWFSQVIRIRGTLNGYTLPIFAGIIDNIEIERISLNESTFTITALDPVTIAGRSTITDPANGYLLYTTNAISLAINGYTDGSTTVFSEVAFPTFGSNTGEKGEVYPNDITAPVTLPSLIQSDLINAGIVADQINNTMLPSGPVVAWTADIYSSSQPFLSFYLQVLDYPLSRADSNAYYFEFRIPWNNNYGAYELPAVSFTEGFLKDNLSNSANVVSSDNLRSATSTDDGSIAAYGMRNKSFTATGNYETSSNERVAQFWANRFSTVRYGLSTLTTTYKACQKNNSTTAKTDVMNLLGSLGGVWQELRIKNGNNPTDITKYMILGRTIRATPTDTQIELRLGWFFDFSSIILAGGSRSGTTNELGGNGYDAIEVSYDNASVDYNHGPVTGSRLA